MTLSIGKESENTGGKEEIRNQITQFDTIIPHASTDEINAMRLWMLSDSYELPLRSHHRDEDTVLTSLFSSLQRFRAGIMADHA